MLLRNSLRQVLPSLRVQPYSSRRPRGSHPKCGVGGEVRRVYDVEVRLHGRWEGLEHREGSVDWGHACLMEEEVGFLMRHVVEEGSAGAGHHLGGHERLKDLGVVEVVACKGHRTATPLYPETYAGDRMEGVEEVEVGALQPEGCAYDRRPVPVRPLEEPLRYLRKRRIFPAMGRRAKRRGRGLRAKRGRDMLDGRGAKRRARGL